MRTIAVFVVGLLVAPLCADEPKKGEWTKTSMHKGQFEVSFPQKPKETATSSGKQYMVELMEGRAVLLSTVNPFPSKIDLSKKDVVKKVFDGAVGGLKKSIKGKTVSDRESIFMGKYPARDLDLQVPALGIYRTRWVLTEVGFVQLVAAGPKDFVDGADAKKFLKSLKIKK